MRLLANGPPVTSALHVDDRTEHQGGDDRVDRAVREGQLLRPTVHHAHRYAALPGSQPRLQLLAHPGKRFNQVDVVSLDIVPDVGARPGADLHDSAGQVADESGPDRAEEGALDLGEDPVVTVGEATGPVVLGDRRQAHPPTFARRRLDRRPVSAADHQSLALQSPAQGQAGS